MPRHEKNQPHLPMSPRPWIRPFLTPIDSASTSTHMEVTAITNRPTPPASHSPLMFDRCVIWTISDSSALLWLLYGCTPHPRHLGATLAPRWPHLGAVLRVCTVHFSISQLVKGFSSAAPTRGHVRAAFYEMDQRHCAASM